VCVCLTTAWRGERIREARAPSRALTGEEIAAQFVTLAAIRTIRPIVALNGHATLPFHRNLIAVGLFEAVAFRLIRVDEDRDL